MDGIGPFKNRNIDQSQKGTWACLGFELEAAFIYSFNFLVEVEAGDGRFFLKSKELFGSN